MKTVAILAQSTSHNVRYRRINAESLTMSSARSSTEKVEKVVMYEEVRLKDFMREGVIAMKQWHEDKRTSARFFEAEKIRMLEGFTRSLRAHLNLTDLYNERNARFYEATIEAKEEWRKDFENRKKQSRRNLIARKRKIKTDRVEKTNKDDSKRLSVERQCDSEVSEKQVMHDSSDSDNNEYWDEVTSEEPEAGKIDEQTKERPPKRAKTQALKESELHLLHCIKAWANCRSEHLQDTP